jgi:hypothetical protein
MLLLSPAAFPSHSKMFHLTLSVRRRVAVSAFVFFVEEEECGLTLSFCAFSHHSCAMLQAVGYHEKI